MNRHDLEQKLHTMTQAQAHSTGGGLRPTKHLDIKIVNSWKLRRRKRTELFLTFLLSHTMANCGILFRLFDGWEVPDRSSVVTEVYPALWSRSFPSHGQTADQHDAYSVAAWMQNTDREGCLAEFFHPVLTPDERTQAQIEGWILGGP